ncbi:hypothetical protein H4R34_002510 [Dimargaris verticillata]|uniref:DUF4042 domain-containing protein n=1 Tax=Dimargaris verticillata TaxID=2761393 RepID=A0A9W8EE05_9FUNG|nr:hypothetical protein H4R34_002510 [Dimargaris verticillata]
MSKSSPAGTKSGFQALKSLDQLRHDPTRPLQATLDALGSVAKACAQAGTKQPTLTAEAGTVLIAVLVQKSTQLTTSLPPTQRTATARVVAQTLRSVKACLVADKRALAPHTAELTSALQVCLFHRMPRQLHLTHLPSPTRPISSESEFTEYPLSDAPGRAARATRGEMVVRQALVCLAAAVKSYPRLLSTIWDQYLPEATVDTRPNLFTLLRQETNSQTRSQVLLTLFTLLDHARSLLQLADDRYSPTAFTPLAVRVARMVSEVHRRLYGLLSGDAGIEQRVLGLRCLAVVASHCPYDHLQLPLVPQLCDAIQPCLCHSDPLVQVQALTALTALVSRTERLSSQLFSTIMSCKARYRGHTDTLTNVCQVGAFDGTGELLVRQALGHLMVALVNAYPAQLTSIVPTWLENTSTHFEASPPSLQVEFINVVEACYKHGMLENSVLSSTTSTPIPGNQYVETLVLRHIGNVGPPVRTALYDLVASIPPKVFESLAASQCNAVAHLTLAGTEDDSSEVQVAAFRALGFLAMHQIYREDLVFIVDALHRVSHDAIPQTLLATRIKAAWAFANLTDAMAWAIQHTPADAALYFNGPLWEGLVRSGLALLPGDERLKISGLRVLGNLLGMAQTAWFRQGGRDVSRVLPTLAKQVGQGPFKVRWNACHALGNILKNPTLPAVGEWNQCVRQSVEALVQALDNPKNMKVRINATTALGSPPTLDNYGGSDAAVNTAESILKATQAETADLLSSLGMPSVTIDQELLPSPNSSPARVCTLTGVTDTWRQNHHYQLLLVEALQRALQNLSTLLATVSLAPSIAELTAKLAHSSAHWQRLQAAGVYADQPSR